MGATILMILFDNVQVFLIQQSFSGVPGVNPYVPIPIVNNTVHIITQNCYVNITYWDHKDEGSTANQYAVYGEAERGSDYSYNSQFDYFVGPVWHVYKPNYNFGGTLDCRVCISVLSLIMTCFCQSWRWIGILLGVEFWIVSFQVRIVFNVQVLHNNTWPNLILETRNDIYTDVRDASLARFSSVWTLMRYRCVFLFLFFCWC